MILLGNTVIICGCNCVVVIQCCFDLENLDMWKCYSFVVIYFSEYSTYKELVLADLLKQMYLSLQCGIIQ